MLAFGYQSNTLIGKNWYLFLVSLFLLYQITTTASVSLFSIKNKLRLMIVITPSSFRFNILNHSKTTINLKLKKNKKIMTVSEKIVLNIIT